jgi:alanine racemase
VSTGALVWNLRQLAGLLGEDCLLAPTVKANAYGHGIEIAARAFVEAGADRLCLDSIEECRTLRQAGFEIPLHVMGYVPPVQMPDAMDLDVSLVVYDAAVVEAAAAEHRRSGREARFHVKVETGAQRQGLDPGDAVALADHIAGTAGTVLEGACTHFANIEDTTDHSYAREQIRTFLDVVQSIRARGIDVPLRHVSNSAALILWPEAHMEMARAGIAAYGMWPSSETRVAALIAGRAEIALRPALTWKSRIAQIRRVQAGTSIGYGLTYRTTHPVDLAVVPCGYYDGYDRSLGNVAHVLVGGVRAPVRGRVCMNMLMIDVSDAPDPVPGDEVVFLGRQGEEEVTAEMMATWCGSINYEITTRIRETLPRLAIP